MGRLTSEIAFYRKYHRHPVNVGLHIVGIPTILATSIYNMSYFRLFGATYLTVGVIMGMYYWYYYSRLDPKFGPLVGFAVAATAVYSAYATSGHKDTHYGLSWLLWSAGWIAQFIGHGAFEGKAPALFDNLHQALILAPYFAFLEVAAIAGWSHAKNEIAKVDLINPDGTYATKH